MFALLLRGTAALGRFGDDVSSIRLRGRAGKWLLKTTVNALGRVSDDWSLHYDASETCAYMNLGDDGEWNDYEAGEAASMVLFLAAFMPVAWGIAFHEIASAFGTTASLVSLVPLLAAGFAGLGVLDLREEFEVRNDRAHRVEVAY